MFLCIVSRIFCFCLSHRPFRVHLYSCMIFAFMRPNRISIESHTVTDRAAATSLAALIGTLAKVIRATPLQLLVRVQGQIYR
jgi:hypothetical protein